MSYTSIRSIPFSLWLQGSRPKTWAASLAPVLIGSLFALSSSFSFLLFISTALFALSIQILTNFCNDYFDFLQGADTKERKGPLRLMQTGLISVEQMRTMIALILLGCFFFYIPLFFQGGLLTIPLFFISLLLSFGYTANPLALAYRGLGEVFVWIFFGPVATGMTYFLQTASFPPFIIGESLAPGFLSSAILLINNLRDIEEDSKTGKKTFCVRFGRKWGKIAYTSALLLAALPSFFSLRFLTLIYLLPALSILMPLWKAGSSAPWNKWLAKTALLLYLYIFSLALHLFFT